jgi:amino acid transporter
MASTMTTTALGRDDERLVRAIGLPTLTASIVNLTIGAGIFVLPAVAVQRLGPAAPLAYIVCAALMGLILACFAAAGSRVSLTTRTSKSRSDRSSDFSAERSTG